MNAPKLRFKEFNTEWVTETLRKYLTFNNGINAEKDSYGHGRKFINVLDILNNNFITYDKIIGSVSVSPKIEESNKVEYGDILFLRSSETREDVGKSSVYLDKEEHALFGGFVIRGKKQGEYHPYFLKLNLESPNVRNQIGSKAGGSTRFNVSQAILSSVELNMPSIDEQVLIAEFFEKLDIKIQKQREKVELLKQQKNGLLQKIFKQEFRFKDEQGNDFPDWHQNIKATDLFKSVSDKKHDGHMPILAATQNEGIVLRDQLDRHFSAAEENYKNYKRVSPNDFVISLRSFQGGIEFSELDGLMSPAYTIFRPIDNKLVNVHYFKLLFKSTDFITRLNGLTYGIRDGKAISFTDFSYMKFTFPSFTEQRKIADFLSAFNQKIKIEQTKLEALQAQKKGFTQQMFI